MLMRGDCGQVSRCNLRARFWARAELEDGDVSQPLPQYFGVPVDVSIGECKCKAGVFIAAVGVSFAGSHTRAEWHLNAVQIASV